jgi:catechol 2,3-dioxygenase-like lactoylglutathione lyase family enzyme
MTEPPRRIAAVRIFVPDLSGALAFYRDTLGLSLVASAPTFLVFAAGVDFIVEELSSNGAHAEQAMGRFLGLSFRSEDIAKDIVRLKERGIRFHSDPQSQEWGGWLAQFDDPFGHTLTLAQYPDV